MNRRMEEDIGRRRRPWKNRGRIGRLGRRRKTYCPIPHELPDLSFPPSPASSSFSHSLPNLPMSQVLPFFQRLPSLKSSDIFPVFPVFQRLPSLPSLPSLRTSSKSSKSSNVFPRLP